MEREAQSKIKTFKQKEHPWGALFAGIRHRGKYEVDRRRIEKKRFCCLALRDIGAESRIPFVQGTKRALIHHRSTKQKEHPKGVLFAGIRHRGKYEVDRRRIERRDFVVSPCETSAPRVESLPCKARNVL